MTTQSKKLIVSCSLTIMLVIILLTLIPTQPLPVRAIAGGFIGLLSALLIESVWTK